MSFKESLKQWMDKSLPPSLNRRLKRSRKHLLGWWQQNDLSRLAILYGTDKWGPHRYTPHYERYFHSMKSRRLNVLEIGVGGYESFDVGGGSLQMWKAYFRKSQIVGIDLYDKTHMSESRIDVRQCDQTDKEGLISLSKEYGGFDIIIDDGSHINQHVIGSFEVLFPLLRPRGVYVAEDLQTSYWASFGGGIDNPKSSMSYFKRLVDGLNYAEYPIANYQPTFLDLNIVEISFVHNMAFILKGTNDEPTNCAAEIKHEIETSTSNSLRA